jgi:hypothetical protein
MVLLSKDSWPDHLLTGGAYGSVQLTQTIDVAPWEDGYMVFLNFATVTGDCSVVVQDSETGTGGWANTAYSFTESGGAGNDTRAIFLHRNKVRRYVRIGVTPTTNVTVAVSGVGVGRSNGEVPSFSFSVDTGA